MSSEQQPTENKKAYSNGDITVLWEPRVCEHAGVCVRTLGAVFQPHQKPWIRMDGASSEQIIAAVSKCPSGALSIKPKE